MNKTSLSKDERHNEIARILCEPVAEEESPFYNNQPEKASFFAILEFEGGALDIQTFSCGTADLEKTVTHSDELARRIVETIKDFAAEYGIQETEDSGKDEPEEK